MSNDPNDAPPKDYYINMGKQQGVRQGTLLEVRRRVSTYDLLSEQLYRDLTVPVALVKVIHVEPVAAIARLQKLLPIGSTPVVAPRAIMVGDLVRLAEEKLPRRSVAGKVSSKGRLGKIAQKSAEKTASESDCCKKLEAAKLSVASSNIDSKTAYSEAANLNSGR